MTTTRKPRGHQIPAGAPVRAWHVESMAERMAASARDRAFKAGQGIDSPAYLRAVRADIRQRKALRRLAVALQRQPGVTW